MKYLVEGFFDNSLAVLADSKETDDFDTVKDIAWEMAFHGDFVKIRNRDTGEEQVYDPDEWEAAVECGGYPSRVMELL